MAHSRSPLFGAVDPDLLGSGLLPDIHAALVPLWEHAVNVRFVDGKVIRKRENTRLVSGQGLTNRGIGQQSLVDGTKVLWFVAGNKLWRWDGFYLQQITTLSTLGISSPYVDFTFYGDWALVNTSNGPVGYWNGSTFATIAQMPINAALVRKHLSFLMAFGTGSRKTGVSWSDANDISVWTPATDNSAGSVFLNEFDSSIISAAPLGAHQAVYSLNQMGLVTFIGDPFYFGQRTVLTGIGALGKFAVTSDGKSNYGVSRNGIWQTNGSDKRFLDSGKLHKHLQDNVDWEQGNKIIACRNDLLRTVDFYFPLIGADGLTEGWSFDPTNEGFSKIPAVDFQDDRTLFGAPLVGAKNGWVELLDVENANLLNMELRTRPLLMQLRDARGLSDVHTETRVHEIEIFMHRAHNVEVRIGSSMEAKGTYSWSSWIELDPNETTYEVPAGTPDGVYWKLEFRSVAEVQDVLEGTENVLDGAEQVVAATDNTSWDFDLQGFMLFGEVTGAKPSF